jgi:sugar phosphate isomerase/epimerase
VRGDAEVVLHNVCNAASILGAKYITFHGPLKLKRQQYVHNYDNIAITINKICDILTQYGLKLSYENIHYGYFDNPGYFATLSQLCPELYATIDVKQAVQGGKNPLEFLKACSDRISTIHLCDVDLNNSPCLPLDGVIDFDSIFNYLVSNDIRVPLLLELYSSSYRHREQDIVDSYDKLANKLANTKGNIIKFELKE